MAGQLAGQSDRGLFLFALVVLGSFGLAVVRYLVRRGEKQSQELAGLFQEANVGRVELAKALGANTEVLCETREQLRENTEILRRVFRLEDK